METTQETMQSVVIERKDKLASSLSCGGDLSLQQNVGKGDKIHRHPFYP